MHSEGGVSAFNTPPRLSQEIEEAERRQKEEEESQEDEPDVGSDTAGGGGSGTSPPVTDPALSSAVCLAPRNPVPPRTQTRTDPRDACGFNSEPYIRDLRTKSSTSPN